MAVEAHPVDGAVEALEVPVLAAVEGGCDLGEPQLQVIDLLLQADHLHREAGALRLNVREDFGHDKELTNECSGYQPSLLRRRERPKTNGTEQVPLAARKHCRPGP